MIAGMLLLEHGGYLLDLVQDVCLMSASVLQTTFKATRLILGVHILLSWATLGVLSVDLLRLL